MKLSREVKTAIFAIVTILLFIFGYNFLKGTSLFVNSRTFYVKYQSVEGLTQSAPVTINGLTVGKIKNIDFADSEGKLLVTFSVDKDFDFSKNSLVRIYSTSLIGGKALAILPGTGSQKAISGDYLEGQIEKGMLETVSGGLKPLETRVINTMSNLDTLLTNVNTILDKDTQANLKLAIANLNQTMASFKGASRNLDAILNTNKNKLDHTFSNLEEITNHFSKFSEELAKVEVETLVQDLEKMISGFQGIISDMENGKGSIGKLLKDEKLYQNLEGASKQLEELLQDVKLHPKRYIHLSVFGKKAKEYEKPNDPKL
ncbi:MAG: MlaD family protein [Flavobacteriales bacterium]